MMMFRHRIVFPLNFLLQTSAAVASAEYRCNGMYQPYTIAGNQPMYFDQVAAIYRHYTVIASKMKCTFSISQPTATVNYATVGIKVNDDGVSPTGAPSVLSHPTTTYGVCTNANGPLVLTKNWSARRAFGGNTMDNDQLRGNDTTNPVEEQYFTIFAYTNDTTYAQVVALAEIEYTAVWTELRDVLIS